jgi:penicillin-binding protein 1A
LKREMGLSLGAAEVNLLELTAAYGAFANHGRGVWPVGVTEIKDAQGRVIYNRLASGPGAVIDETALYYMNDMLAAVMTQGTGRAAAIDRPAAGKTGTTDDSRDAWFIGYTADYVAGVWVGNDDSSPMKNVTGGGLPSRLWHDVMLEAHRGLPLRPLPGREPGFFDRLRDSLFGTTSG